jgi:hypothetical protein
MSDSPFAKHGTKEQNVAVDLAINRMRVCSIQITTVVKFENACIDYMECKMIYLGII